MSEMTPMQMLTLRAIAQLEDRGELPANADKVLAEIRRMADAGDPEALAFRARHES